MSTLLDQQIAQHLEDVQARWQRGIRSFFQTLERVKYLRESRKLDREREIVKVIRSAVHGDIYVNRVELLLLDSFYLQRLRNVSQMGLLHLVFPDARHSRFEHTLGVLHMAKRLLAKESFLVEKVTAQTHYDLAFAAILHDVGHGPFSHAAESVLAAVGLDETMRGERYHEARVVSMIGETDFQLKRLAQDRYGIREFLEKTDCTPDRIVKLITGGDDWLAPAMNGPIDIDKLEYFQRDAYYTGVPSGAIDADRLLSLVRINRKDDVPQEIGFDPKSVVSLLQFIYARQFVYGATIFHPVVRIVEAMLIIAFDLALRDLPPNLARDIVLDLELMDDYDLIRFLEIVAFGSEKSPTRTLLRMILDGIRTRTLLKRIRMIGVSTILQDTGYASAGDLCEVLGSCVYFAISNFSKSSISELEEACPGISSGIVGLVLQEPPRRIEDARDTLERLRIIREKDVQTLTGELLATNPTLEYGLSDTNLHGRAIARLERDLWKAQLLIQAEHREAARMKSKEVEIGEILWREISREIREVKENVDAPVSWRPSTENYTDVQREVKQELVRLGWKEVPGDAQLE
jgi:HD superfamily phosphohydrolase